MDYDELVSRCLAEYQARVDVGVTTIDPDDTELAAPPEVRQRIQRGRECILLLSDGGVAQTRTDLRDEQTKEIDVRPAGMNGDEREVVLPHVSLDAGTNGRQHQGKKSIGRFQIRAELGAGGFGIVYRAWDPRTEREVALKIPKFEALASADLQRRFEQEARAAGRLDHPNIVGVLEAGTDGLLPFIASVYYPGITLADWHRRRDRPAAPRDAAQLILKLAQALEHAHQRGVLHRDIKPSNILLVSRLEENAEGFLASAVPKLMDFGLAKLAGEIQDMTRTGTMLGTLRYMPPEQAMGDSKAIGPRSDVFSLGAVLYELLSGAPPLRGDNEIELLRKIPTEQPSNIRRKRPTVPVDLETITFKCLEKEPSRRYASAQELADDLDRYLQGLPIQARPATRPERLVKWIRRNPVWAALWAVSGFAMLAIVLGLGWSSVIFRRERDLARASEVRANQYIYATDMQLAQEALHNHNLIQTQNLLSRYVVKPGERDYRDFTWGVLDQVLRRYEAKLPRHPSDVYSVAFSPAGRFLATACKDGKTRIWSWPQRMLVKELADHRGEVNEVAYSPDGRWLATGGDDGRVLLRDSATLEIRHELLPGDAEEPAPIVGVVFAPDSQRVYIGAGHDLSVWNVETGACENSQATGELIRDLCVSPDGNLLATAQNNAVVWSAHELEIVTQCESDGISTSCCFLPDSERLVVSEDGKLVVRGAFDGSVERDRTNTHRGKVRALATDPNCRLLVSASDDQFIEVRDALNWAPVARLFGHTQRIWDVALAPDGRHFVSAAADGEVLIWNSPVDNRFERADGVVWRAVFADTPALAYSTDNSLLAVASGQDYVTFLDLATGASTHLPVPGAEIVDAVFAHDSRSLLAADSTGKLVRCDIRTGEVSNLCSVPKQLLRNSLARSLSGDRVAVASNEAKCVVLLDWPSGRELHRFATSDETVDAVRFTPDGRRLIVAAGPTLSCFELESYRPVYRYTKPGRYSDLAVLADGKRMVCAEGREGAVIRSLDTGEELDRLSGHTGDVVSVAAHPNGTNVASICSDRQLRIWDLNSRSAVLGFDSLVPAAGGGLKFSATGDELLVAHDTVLHEIMAFETKPSLPFDLVDPIAIDSHPPRWERWPSAAVTRRMSTLRLGSRVRAIAWNSVHGFMHASLDNGSVIAVMPDSLDFIQQTWPSGPKGVRLVNAIGFGPTAKQFFTVSNKGEVGWHNHDGRHFADRRIPEGALYPTYSENCVQLAFVANQHLIVVDGTTAEELWRQAMPAPVAALAMRKPGQVAVVSDDHKLRQYDLANGALQSEAPFESGIVGPQGLQWSEDGQRLIAIRDGRVSIHELSRLDGPWDISTRKADPNAFFWGDDRLVVHDELELRVYDLNRRSLIAVMMAPAGEHAMFDPKQGILATAQGDIISLTWLDRSSDEAVSSVKPVVSASTTAATRGSRHQPANQGQTRQDD